jgi:hypothetical protein
MGAMYFCARRCQAVSGVFHALKTRKIYSPEYVYKPNVSAEIWGVLLKTGEYADFRFFFTMLFAHTGLLCRGWCDGFGRCCVANDKTCVGGRGVICQCMMGWRYRCMP